MMSRHVRELQELRFQWLHLWTMTSWCRAALANSVELGILGQCRTTINIPGAVDTWNHMARADLVKRAAREPR